MQAVRVHGCRLCASSWRGAEDIGLVRETPASSSSSRAPSVFRYGLDELVLNGFPEPWLSRLARWLTIGGGAPARPAGSLRQALECLGPIFVKFGQVLSTRRDLMPVDIADELALLQDRVPPFAPDVAIATIERSLGKPIGRRCFLVSSGSRLPAHPSPRFTLPSCATAR